MVKQPGQGTHIVDGGHEEEDDADDVDGKDGSQEDQHDDLLEEERESRGNLLDCLLRDNQRARRAQESAEPRNSNKTANRLRKLHKSRPGTVSGCGFFDF